MEFKNVHRIDWTEPDGPHQLFFHNGKSPPFGEDDTRHLIEKQAYDNAIFERNAWHEKYREAMGDVAADHILKALDEPQKKCATCGRVLNAPRSAAQIPASATPSRTDETP